MEEGLCVFDNPNRRAVTVVVVLLIIGRDAITNLLM